MLWGRFMGSRNYSRFLEAVAEAARSKKPVYSRGKPTPENLNTEGRRKGLQAMWSAPRCKGTRRDGERCKAAAMRGAKRCLKHGGRMDVPDHPHNVHRFMTGRLGKPPPPKNEGKTDECVWNALTYRQKFELLSLVSEKTRKNPDQLFLAARIWSEVKGRSPQAEQRFFDMFLRA